MRTLICCYDTVHRLPHGIQLCYHHMTYFDLSSVDEKIEIPDNPARGVIEAKLKGIQAGLISSHIANFPYGLQTAAANSFRILTNVQAMLDTATRLFDEFYRSHPKAFVIDDLVDEDRFKDLLSTEDFQQGQLDYQKALDLVCFSDREPSAGQLAGLAPTVFGIFYASIVLWATAHQDTGGKGRNVPVSLSEKSYNGTRFDSGVKGFKYFREKRNSLLAHVNSHDALKDSRGLYSGWSRDFVLFGALVLEGIRKARAECCQELGVKDNCGWGHQGHLLSASIKDMARCFPKVVFRIRPNFLPGAAAAKG